MQDKQYQYVLAEWPDAERLRDWLALEEGGLSGRESGGCRRTYLDTFDWRLYHRNLVLELDETRPMHQLRLRNRGRETGVISQPVESMPRFPADLPPGRLRDRLVKLCRMRALLPVVSTYYDYASSDVRDDSGKTIVRLIGSRYHHNDGSRNNVVHEQLVFEPLRGYRDAADAVRVKLESRIPLADEQIDPFDCLCRQHDIHPGLYQTKLKLPLSPDERADQALGRILGYLLSIMEVNETGIIDDLDTEFLHDFRIACRRSRTLLTQVRDVLPQRDRDHAKSVFAWLSEITGPYRDMDVFLLDLDKLVGNAGLECKREAIADLHHVLEQERRTARARLLRGLRSRRYERFKKDWHDFLQAACAGECDAGASGEPAKAVADRNIWRVYKKIVKEGADLDPAADPVALHELRKRAKKLRYLLEAFQTLYPPEAIGDVIGSLKTLQDNMGAIVDAAVQGETLQHVRDDLRAGFKSEQTEGLVRELVDYCDKRHEALLGDFTEAFAEFARKKNRKRCRALFKPAE
ncbi:MAG: CHAD domain-containing protein [Gammaproteobacteria bacterium]|nr:CHAD domain-containing protein [Gammaproteobacteria bacterium]